MTHRVVFIGPREEPGMYHDRVLRFAGIAAEGLGIEFTSLDISSTADPRSTVAKLVSGPERPAAAITVNFQNTAAAQLEIFNAAGIHAVVACEGFYESDRGTVGVPGSPYRHWLSEIMPDDQEVGRLLGTTLLDRAVAERRLGPDGELRLLGLSGPFTQAATNRLTGLREAVRQCEATVRYDLRMAEWSEAKAYKLTQEYLQQARPQVLWGANDSMAIGAARALQEAGLAPGRDVLIGGVDWVGDALRHVTQGRFTTSVGGHLLDGVWALIMIHDALRGQPPPAERSQTSSMVAVTKDNASHYLRAVDESYLRTVDFAERFSRSDGRYDFSLERLLD